MTTPLIDNLEKMLASGKDTALLRFGLGKAYLDAANPSQAVTHLARAVELKRDYSAAWKLLGKARHAAGDTPGAIDAYRQGIAIAGETGDKQAMKEMQVFKKRLEQASG